MDFPLSENRACDGQPGAATSPFALADQVYEMSSVLGTLRAQSVAHIGALRSVAQGTPELDEAFRPLFAALETGLVECDRAIVEAVLGRPLSPRNSPAAGRGISEEGGDSGPSGTIVAVQRLVRAISALNQDVKAVGMLAEHAESFRDIARWAWRAAAPAILAQARSAPSERAAKNQDVAGSGNVSTGRYEHGLERQVCDDWTLRIFRQHASDLNRSFDSDSGPDDAVGSSKHVARGASTSYVSGIVEQDSAGLPLVAVRVLGVILPQECTAPATVVPNAIGLSNSTGSPTSTCAMGVPATSHRRWCNPFSWVSRLCGRTSAEAPQAPEQPLAPKRPSLALPTVVVRVVYAGRVLDMVRLVSATQRGSKARGQSAGAGQCIVDTAADAGRDNASPLNTVDRAIHEDASPRSSASREGSAAEVELVRSEVRVPQADFLSVTRVGTELASPTDTSSGGQSLHLQIVLRLRTRTPVVVSRLLHTGGGVLPSPAPSPSHSSSSRPRVSARSTILSSAHPSPRQHRNVMVENTATGGLPIGTGHGKPESIFGTANGDGVGLRHAVVSSGGGDDVGGGVGVDVGAGVGEGTAGDDRGCHDRDGDSGSNDGGWGGRGNHGDDVWSAELDRKKGHDAIPSGWTEKPVGFLSPEGFMESGCELKIGTDHLLGMNVLLPSQPPPPNGNFQRQQVDRLQAEPRFQRRSQRDSTLAIAARGPEPEASQLLARDLSSPEWNNEELDNDRCPVTIPMKGARGDWRRLHQDEGHQQAPWCGGEKRSGSADTGDWVATRGPSGRGATDDDLADYRRSNGGGRSKPDHEVFDNNYFPRATTRSAAAACLDGGHGTDGGAKEAKRRRKSEQGRGVPRHSGREPGDRRGHAASTPEPFGQLRQQQQQRGRNREASQTRPSGERPAGVTEGKSPPDPYCGGGGDPYCGGGGDGREDIISGREATKPRSFSGSSGDVSHESGYCIPSRRSPLVVTVVLALPRNADSLQQIRDHCPSSPEVG